MPKQKTKRPAGKPGNGSGRNKTAARQRAHAVGVRENAKAGLVNDATTGAWRQPQTDSEKTAARNGSAGARWDKPAHECRPRKGGAVHWTPSR